MQVFKNQFSNDEIDQNTNFAKLPSAKGFRTEGDGIAGGGQLNPCGSFITNLFKRPMLVPGFNLEDVDRSEKITTQYSKI